MIGWSSFASKVVTSEFFATRRLVGGFNIWRLVLHYQVCGYWKHLKVLFFVHFNVQMSLIFSKLIHDPLTYLFPGIQYEQCNLKKHPNTNSVFCSLKNMLSFTEVTQNFINYFILHLVCWKSNYNWKNICVFACIIL